MPAPTTTDQKPWTEKLSRSGYFFGALVMHIVIFVLIATWVIFPAFNPPQADFNKTYVPPASTPPPPPPPVTQSPQVPTQTLSAPTTITSPNPTASFSVPIPDLTPSTTPADVKQQMTQSVASPKSNTLSTARLEKIKAFTETYREHNNVIESDGDPRNVKLSKFPVYLASYADGDWYCNVQLDGSKQIVSGSLPNLVAKINEWSRGNINGEVEPQALSIGGPDLLAKRPPFIFFTGHKDFKLTDTEIKNLQDYLQEGGCIWGDNALPGRGSRFDVAFRREMKRVVPDLDKNFEPVKQDSDVFNKSWFPITKVPQGMNYYTEPLEHLDIDGKLAIFYTPNDYSDMFSMLILPGDIKMGPTRVYKNATSPLITNGVFWSNKRIYFRNFDLPPCLASDQLGLNIIGYLLVRFDKDLLLTP
jgi:Domain of unknown function (DUF4159)